MVLRLVPTARGLESERRHRKGTGKGGSLQQMRDLPACRNPIQFRKIANGKLTASK